MNSTHLKCDSDLVRDVWQGKVKFEELRTKSQEPGAREKGIYSAYTLVADIGSCGWLATVIVPDHEPAQSAIKGQFLVELALDFLSLFLNSDSGTRLLHPGIQPPLRESTLALGPDGGLFGGWKINKPGVGGRPGFALDVLKESHRLRDDAGIILQRYAEESSVGRVSRLIERWANALCWYGEALRERSDFIALVKYGCAIDILSGAGGDLGPMVAFAEAALSCRGDDKLTADGLTLRENLHRVYNEGRSALAHGSSFGLMAERSLDRARASELTRFLLIEITPVLADVAKQNNRMLTLDKDEMRAFIPRLKSARSVLKR